MPQKAPMLVDNRTILRNEFVINLVTMGGITIAAAIKVTPKICMETTIAPAKTKEKVVSTQAVGTP